MIHPLTLNYPQLRSLLTPALIEVDVWGRGTGKSTGIGMHAQRMVKMLPRSSPVFLGVTYTNLLTITLAEVVNTWERLGYREGVHFLIRKKPPAKWRWPKPLHPPVSYDNYIIWYNGTGFHLASQDPGAPFRGSNASGLYADEAALLDKIKLDEQVRPAIRGDVEYFRHHPLLHFEKYATSKPIGTKGAWVLDFAKYYEADGKQYELMLRQLVKLKVQFIDASSALERRMIFEEIKKRKAQIKWYAKNGVFYNEADGFDNIKNLGPKWFHKQKLLSSPIKFRVEVLNETMRNALTCFYPSFDEEKHTYYDTERYEHINNLEINFRKIPTRNSQWDADLSPDLPLRMAADFGASFNCIVVWQRQGNVVRILNAFWVKPPEILDHVFTLAAQYYTHHKHRSIKLWYDRTGNNRKDNSNLTSAQQAQKVLNGHGFSVQLMSKGRNPHHEKKYLLAQKVLQETDERLPRIRINGNRCKNLITSIMLSPLVMGSRGEHKDKRSEKQADYPQEDATHLSDVFDMILEAEADLTGNTYTPAARTA